MVAVVVVVGTSSLYLCLGGDLGVHHCLQQLLWMHLGMLLVPPIQLGALLQRWRLVLVPGTGHVNVQLDIAANMGCGVSVVLAVEVSPTIWHTYHSGRRSRTFCSLTMAINSVSRCTNH